MFQVTVFGHLMLSYDRKSDSTTPIRFCMHLVNHVGRYALDALLEERMMKMVPTRLCRPKVYVIGERGSGRLTS
jgi:hypothetical protein